MAPQMRLRVVRLPFTGQRVRAFRWEREKVGRGSAAASGWELPFHFASSDRIKARVVGQLPKVSVKVLTKVRVDAFPWTDVVLPGQGLRSA
ncbi:hypothetical protein GCM10022232_37230 [Streptomyces plumbiresistens]|uniref:Uncharacterized protein n=1 Tax=Streptomyces plumbiresistens TaxID=511811 RepID=A0ABP7RFQ4_9ACTN